MRLTLRTLLAYLDDTLEPLQAKEIGQKVNESDFAKQLTTRIREVMRRRRLSAPPLGGPEAGLDPNTVAEYLDNTLPPERVPEVEKACLSSDVHLAEAAACHQVLTLVLGEPADVPEESRQRMYKLPWAQPAEPAPEKSTAPAADDDSLWANVPDYLRQRRPRQKLLPLAAIAALALLALGLYLSVRPGTQNPPTPAQVAAEPPPPAPPTPEPPTHAPPQAPAASPASVAQAPTKPAPEPPSSPPRPAPDTTPTTPELPATKPQPSPAPAAAPAVAAKTPTPMPPSVPTPAAEPDAKPTTPRLPPVPPVVAGQYVSTSGVLARANQTPPAWERVPFRDLIKPGDQLCNFPRYRSLVQLQGQATLELVGLTTLRLEAAKGSLGMLLDIDFGRLIISAQRPDVRVPLKVAGESWELWLAGPDTYVTLDVDRWLPDGWDAAATPPPVHTELTVVRGKAAWRTPAGERVLDAPVQTGMDAHGLLPIKPVSEPPAWTAREDLTLPQQRGADRFAAAMPESGPLRVALAEAIERRDDAEIRRLAVWGAEATGDLPTLVAALGNPQHPDVRLEAIAALRHCLARGQKDAQRLRQAVDSVKPAAQADTLYWLLCGFGETDAAQTKTYTDLINWLASDDLAVRELAIHNLRRLTERTSDYRADGLQSQRDLAIQRWHRLLKEGGLPPRKRLRTEPAQP